MGCGTSGPDNKGKRVIMMGIDGGGKTTLLYKLCKGQDSPGVRTVGENCEVYNHKKLRLSIFDFGGKDSQISLIKHHFTGAKGLVYVIDCSAPQRIKETKEYFQEIRKDSNLKNQPLLLLLNQMDNNKGMDMDNIEQILSLPVDKQDIDWHMRFSNAQTLEGVIEGFEWLIEKIKNPRTS